MDQQRRKESVLGRNSRPKAERGWVLGEGQPAESKCILDVLTIKSPENASIVAANVVGPTRLGGAPPP